MSSPLMHHWIAKVKQHKNAIRQSAQFPIEQKIKGKDHASVKNFQAKILTGLNVLIESIKLKNGNNFSSIFHKFYIIK
jgi:hypothetical protein